MTGALTCGFHRVETEGPIFFTGAGGALPQLSRILLAPQAQDETVDGASDITMPLRELSDADRRGENDLIFAPEEGLTSRQPFPPWTGEGDDA